MLRNVSKLHSCRFVILISRKEICVSNSEKLILFEFLRFLDLSLHKSTFPT